MLTIKDLYGNEAPLISHTDIEVIDTLNAVGELKTTVYKTEQNQIGFDMINELSLILEEKTKQWYRISKRDYRVTGQTPYVSISCLHVLNDLKRKWVKGFLTNTQTINACMDLLTEGTPFSYEVLGNFDKVEFESFGKGRALDLFLNKILDVYKAEFYVDNYTIYLVNNIGKDNAFLFVDNANISKIQNNYDDTTITTHIEGQGYLDEDNNPLLYGEYTSPAAELYGIIDADYYSNENINSQETLDSYLRSKVQDYPLLQITADYQEFEKGSPLTTLNDIALGNQGFIKDRHGLDVVSRITAITSYPQNENKSPILTFGNIIGNFYQTIISIKKGQKEMRDIINNPTFFVNQNLPTYVKTSAKSVPLIVTDMKNVTQKIDDEIKQGQADKEELEKQIQEAEKAANEYADGKAQEWEVEFEKEREEITNEINTSQVEAEQVAKTYTDGKAHEWEVTFAKEKGLINESINSSEANAIATAKKYADSTTYIDSIKAKILVAESIIAEFLKVDKAMIDKLVTNSLFTTELFAQSAFVTSLKSKSLEAVYADIATLTTKILTADSVTATNLKVDQAMINKLVTNSLFTTSLFAQTAFVTSLKSKSLEAVYADIATLTTKILTADSVTATNLKVDKAMIDKLVTNSIFTTSLFAQTAFVTNLKSKSLEAVYADIATLKTKLLTADSIVTSMIKADAGLFDKIFVNDAVFKRIVSNEGFFDSLMAKKFTGVEIEGGTITNPFNSNFNGAVLTGNSVLSKAEFNIDYKINASGQTGKAYINPLEMGAFLRDSAGKTEWAWGMNSGRLTMTNGTETGTLEAAALVRTQWINLPLGAAFTTAEGNTPQYRVIPQLDGSKMVKFRGQVKRVSGQFQPNQALGFASMPVGLRALRTEFVQAGTNTAYGGRYVAETNGAIQFMGPVATDYVSLTALSYYIS